MESSDRELLLNIVPTHPELKELYAEHLKLEKEVQKFERYTAYSASAALKARQLKKIKLRGMDKINSILNRYRGPEHQLPA